jgi:ribosomal protein L21E
MKNKNIKDVIDSWGKIAHKRFTGRIGYVYTDHEESHYVHSNLSLCEIVEVKEGHFFAEVDD